VTSGGVGGAGAPVEGARDEDFHDFSCEAEFVSGAGLWTDCGCLDRMSRADLLQIAHDRTLDRGSVWMERAQAAEFDRDQMQAALLDAEHRLRLLADRTDDYRPEGMRLRLLREVNLIAEAALHASTGPSSVRAKEDEQ
jgi:hypothetical protein